MKVQMEKIATYVNPTNYVQHNPNVHDGLDGLGSATYQKKFMNKKDCVNNRSLNDSMCSVFIGRQIRIHR